MFVGVGENSRGGWLKGAVDGFKKGKALLLNIWLRNWVVILEEMENSGRTVPGRLCCVWQTRWSGGSDSNSGPDWDGDEKSRFRSCHGIAAVRKRKAEGF